MAVALPYVYLALAAAGTVTAVQSAKMNAASQEASLNYQAQLGKQNEAAAEQQGEAAAQALKRDQQRMIGAATAAYGASGVQLSEGSPADVLGESARMATLDRLTLKYNYKLRGLGYGNQANLDLAGAANARTAGYFNSMSAMIGGGTKIAGGFADGTIKFGG